MKGIDVSNNNGTIDFAKVKASGIDICYIKATEGITYTDPYLTANYAKAKAAGLKIGFYHFLKNNNPEAEVQHFLQAVQSLQNDCLLMIDAEVLLGQTVAEISSNICRFADYIMSQGKQVGLYTGDYFYRDGLNGSVKKLPLWVASYGKTPMANNYIGWQYSESGSINGISTKVDLNEFSEGILIKQEVRKVKNIVVFGNETDRRAAEYLSDALLCPTINGDKPFDYSTVENVYCVGGPGQLPFTAMAKRTIAGKDRYDTCQQVLNFISNGCK